VARLARGGEVMRGLGMIFLYFQAIGCNTGSAVAFL
jgi:hypothetical protein